MWQAVVCKMKGYDLPPLSHHTTSTHKAYIARFRKDLPGGPVPCGYSDRSLLHIIYECPRFERQQGEMGGPVPWDQIPMGHFFRDVSTAWVFLYFLQFTRAAFPFNPGGAGETD